MTTEQALLEIQQLHNEAIQTARNLGRAQGYTEGLKVGYIQGHHDGLYEGVRDASNSDSDLRRPFDGT